MNFTSLWTRARPGRRAAFAAMLGAVVSMGGAAASPAASPPKRAASQVLNVNLAIIPIMDPTQWGTSASYTIQDNLFVRLTAVDPKTHKVMPSLATSWSSSKDFKTWTFQLRRDAKFADGKPITSADVRYTLVRNYTVLNADQMKALGATNSFPQGFISLPEIQGGIAASRGQAPAIASTAITAPTKYSVRLRLDVGRNDVPQRLAFPVWGIVQAANVATSEAGNPWWYHAVGSGPYRLASFSAGQSLSLTPNPHWWGPKPILKRVNFIVGTNTQTAEIAYQSGSLDFVKIPYSDVNNLKGSGYQTQLRGYSDNAVSVILVNANAATANPNVVKALTLALDKRTLANRVLEGLPRPALTFTPPQWPGYSAKGYKPLTFDASAAKAAFERSGLDPSRVTIRMAYTGSQDPRAAQAIAQMWQQTLGVTVRVVPSAAAPPANAPESQALNVLLQAQGPTFIAPCSMVQRIKDILITGAGANNVNTKPSNAIESRLDRALEECYAAAPDKVWSKVMEIETMNQVNQVFIPVLWNIDYFIVKPYVRGLKLGPTWNIANLTKVWIAQH